MPKHLTETYDVFKCLKILEILGSLENLTETYDVFKFHFLLMFFAVYFI